MSLLIVPWTKTGYSFHYKSKMAKLVCRKVGCFSRRSFSLNWSGRTIEFDKVNEPEQNDQSSAIPEAVLDAATMLMVLVSTKCCKHRISKYLLNLEELVKRVIKWKIWGLRIVIEQLWTNYIQRSNDGPWLHSLKGQIFRWMK